MFAANLSAVPKDAIQDAWYACGVLKREALAGGRSAPGVQHVVSESAVHDIRIRILCVNCGAGVRGVPHKYAVQELRRRGALWSVEIHSSSPGTRRIAAVDGRRVIVEITVGDGWRGEVNEQRAAF